MLGTTITLAFRAIMRHKLRSFLTTLGIIIGVAAVVTMTTLGNGATAAVREQIASLGANILQLRPGQGFGRGGGGPRPPDFKPEDVTAIANQLTGVRAVAPMAQSSGTAIYEGNVLVPGNRITGPAVVETAVTNVVVHPGQKLAVDEFGNFEITLGD